MDEEHPAELSPGAIEVKGVGKMFRLSRRAPHGILDGDPDSDAERDEDGASDQAEEDGEPPEERRPRELWALRDINFSVEPGERIAVIGANGAGKSTLLRILGGALSCSEGEIRGAGLVMPVSSIRKPLSTELSGRDNLLAMGTLLGIPRDYLSETLPRVARFAEMDRMLDEKVKQYSQGGFARLALAMGLLVEPDIILIDEGFATGDANYRSRCNTLLDGVLTRGATLLYASHNVGMLGDLCTRTIWLHDGRILADGDSRRVIQAYRTAAESRFDDIINIHELALHDDEIETGLEEELSVPSRFEVVTSWHRQARATEAWWRRVIEHRCQKPGASESLPRTVNVEAPSRAGNLLDFTLANAKEHSTRHFLPGEDIHVEIRVRAEAGSEVNLRLEVEANLVLILVADLPHSLAVEEAGIYLFRTVLPGKLTAHQAEWVRHKVRARVFFTDRATGERGLVNTTIWAEIRGDARRELERLRLDAGHLATCVVNPAPLYIAAPDPPPPELSSYVNTAAQRHPWHLRHREPALRMQLDWMVLRALDRAEARSDDPSSTGGEHPPSHETDDGGYDPNARTGETPAAPSRMESQEEPRS